MHTSSFRTVRGYTIVAAICDELAFWRSDESANPDVEILKAIRPAMVMIPNALLLAISSPYAKRGALWDAHRKFYGKSGAPVLVWQADTRSMNPSVPQKEVDRAFEEDAASARAEFAGFSAMTLRRSSTGRWSSDAWSPADSSFRPSMMFPMWPSPILRAARRMR